MKIILKNLTIVLLGCVVIVGCGRKGPLEVPYSTMEKPVRGAPSTKSEEDKPFVLDRLIQ
ncbi:LPS translocon maturation chaperone LptM [Bartonella refiksaydamii]|uniref:LPS translocon maturation chaperone LptM n=1 Tax=Bartonella refiksaydamii TaxID=2654951 RepID=UPI0012EC0E2F|nr:lipoprotein [Bartonella refiksaydamii]